MKKFLLISLIILSGCSQASPSNYLKPDVDIKESKSNSPTSSTPIGISSIRPADDIISSVPASPPTSTLPSTKEETRDITYATYEGGWFEIEYPSDFIVNDTIESNNPGLFDAAVFTSPEDNLDFYIYSPQWNGEPTDIAFMPDTENIVAKTSETVEKDDSIIIINRYTYAAKDGSYTRSYEDIENTTLNARRVVGIQYSDQEAYDDYLEEYLHFKNSLIQYAD